MSTARRFLHEFKASNGRTKVATSLGVSVLAVALALLVGILPAMAGEGANSAEGVEPELVAYGGGSGACEVYGTPGTHELHINNPTTGYYDLHDGTQVYLEVYERDTLFDYTFVDSEWGAYDVIVNGGAQNTWYDNDGQVGILQHDEELHAPQKNARQSYKLSHINLCYEVAPNFICGEEVRREESTGLFRIASITIFSNYLLGCEDKLGSFTIDEGGATVTVQFDGETGEDVPGRLDFTKMFDSGADIEPLEYEPIVDSEDWYEVSWCELRDFEATAGDSGSPDGTEFSEWLGTDDYPTLTGVFDDPTPGSPGDEVQAIACKVAEDEDASGKQFTVVYFEFLDPKFR